MLSVQWKEYKWILRDMDGTLVDSERLCGDVIRKVCSTLLHIELPEDEILSHTGMLEREFYAMILEKYNVQYDLEKIMDLDGLLQVQDEWYNSQLDSVVPFPGAQELPKLLKEKGMKMAVVSGSSHKQIDYILTKIGVRNLMDAIVSSEDYTIGKPDPTGYRLGAEKLGLDPIDCIGFEDAERWIQALNTVGALSVGVKNLGDSDISKAQIQIDHLLDFLPHIDSLS